MKFFLGVGVGVAGTLAYLRYARRGCCTGKTELRAVPANPAGRGVAVGTAEAPAEQSAPRRGVGGGVC